MVKSRKNAKSNADKRGNTQKNKEEKNVPQKYAEKIGSGKLLYPELSYKIRGACFELYKELGCGHKEVVYQRGLIEKLKAANLKVNRERQVPVFVNGKKVGIYTPDLVVNETIMMELKAKKFLTRQDSRQFWQYLQVTPYKLGFLVNFGKPGGIQIIRRVYDTARNK